MITNTMTASIATRRLRLAGLERFGMSFLKNGHPHGDYIVPSLLDQHLRKWTRRGTLDDATAVSGKVAFVARALEPIAIDGVVHSTGEVRTFLAERRERTVGAAKQDTWVVLAGVVEEPNGACRKL
jgi:hypothetical protein